MADRVFTPEQLRWLEENVIGTSIGSGVPGMRPGYYETGVGAAKPAAPGIMNMGTPAPTNPYPSVPGTTLTKTPVKTFDVDGRGNIIGQHKPEPAWANPAPVSVPKSGVNWADVAAPSKAKKSNEGYGDPNSYGFNINTGLYELKKPGEAYQGTPLPVPPPDPAKKLKTTLPVINESLNTWEIGGNKVRPPVVDLGVKWSDVKGPRNKVVLANPNVDPWEGLRGPQGNIETKAAAKAAAPQNLFQKLFGLSLGSNPITSGLATAIGGGLKGPVNPPGMSSSSQEDKFQWTDNTYLPPSIANNPRWK